jgi:hypothetical protein
LTLASIWVSFFIWGTILYLHFVSGTYILEDGTYRYVSAVCLGLAWLLYVLAFTPFPFVPGSSRSFKALTVLIVLAGISGWFGGGLLIAAVNCDGLRSFERTIPVVTDRGWNISMRAALSSGKTLRFSVPAGEWESSAEKALYVSRGRLGIYWAKTR